MSQKVLTVAVPRPLDQTYTYRIRPDLAEQVQLGSWVKVPFGRRSTHAFAVELPQDIESMSEEIDEKKLKDVEGVGPENTVIPQEIYRLCLWAHEYYQAPLGEVFHFAVPAACLGLKSQKKEARSISMEVEPSEEAALQLNLEQSHAIETLAPLIGQTHVSLIKGVTGSGKTEVYIRLAKKALEQGKGVLILVPEIALTPQLYQRFAASIGQPVALWHSALADGKRRDYWAAVRSGEIKVVVGARSAVFAPIQNLGLIVVDEEHDPSYKQEERFRYHARDLAVVRAHQSSSLVVLGSATPSLETLERVREKKYSSLELKERATGGTLPEIQTVQLGKEPLCKGIRTALAQSTVKEIQEVIDRGQQVMVYLNRRGFAAFMICEDCGASVECPDCSISMTVYKGRKELRCHICGHHEQIQFECISCSSDRMKPMGMGTESLEEELPQLVDGLVPLRLDRDKITSTKRLQQVLDDFREGKANALLGTQMLVKGHDFPNVTLVVVVSADSLFSWPDYKSAERAYQVLTQVSGRAGRGIHPGKVLIQTYGVDHPVIRVLQGELSEADFLEQERDLRQALSYPPFGRLARLRFEHRSSQTAHRTALEIKKAVQSLPGVEILGPSQAFIERVRGEYRWDLLLKSPAVGDLQRVILRARSICRKSGWPLLVDVDPNGVG